MHKMMKKMLEDDENIKVHKNYDSMSKESMMIELSKTNKKPSSDQNKKSDVKKK